MNWLRWLYGFQAYVRVRLGYAILRAYPRVLGVYVGSDDPYCGVEVTISGFYGCRDLADYLREAGWRARARGLVTIRPQDAYGVYPWPVRRPPLLTQRDEPPARAIGHRRRRRRAATYE